MIGVLSLVLLVALRLGSNTAYGCSDCSGCPLVFTEIVNGYAIDGNNDKKLLDSTLEDCKQACVDESDFVCYSIDFKQDGTCFLSKARKCDAGVTYKEWSNYKYIERRHICNGQWQTLQAGFAIDDYNRKLINYVATRDECELACESMSDFLCLSIDYNAGLERCYLASVTMEDVPDHYIAAAGWDFRQRTYYCPLSLE